MPRKKGELQKPFDEKDIKSIQNYAGLGLSLENIGALMDVSKSTMDRRLNDDPRVSEAISKGRSTSLHNVANAAYQMAVDKENPAMTMFYLKCRGRWREHRDEPSPQETAQHIVSALSNLGGVSALLKEIRDHKAKKALK